MKQRGDFKRAIIFSHLKGLRVSQATPLGIPSIIRLRPRGLYDVSKFSVINHDILLFSVRIDD